MFFKLRGIEVQNFTVVVFVLGELTLLLFHSLE